MWRQAAAIRLERGHAGRITEVRKSKAHQSRADCEHDAAQLAIWRGSDAADQAAKLAAARASPSHPEILQYEEAWNRVSAVAMAFGKMLALSLPPSCFVGDV